MAGTNFQRWEYGYHHLTGKEAPPLASNIEVKTRICPAVRGLVAQAELICFPMGSFYFSLAANCLPGGMGEAISQNPCPKVFVPNTSPDPELFGKSLADQVREFLFYLRQGETSTFENRQLLNYVLLDESFPVYPGDLGGKELDGTGAKVIKCKLIKRSTYPLLDETLLVKALLSVT